MRTAAVTLVIALLWARAETPNSSSIVHIDAAGVQIDFRVRATRAGSTVHVVLDRESLNCCSGIIETTLHIPYRNGGEHTTNFDFPEGDLRIEGNSYVEKPEEVATAYLILQRITLKVPVPIKDYAGPLAADEGCYRDMLIAFRGTGLQARKMQAELLEFGCVKLIDPAMKVSDIVTRNAAGRRLTWAALVRSDPRSKLGLDMEGGFIVPELVRPGTGYEYKEFTKEDRVMRSEVFPITTSPQ
jgi:hypothetical protein